eukprot:796685_1
MSKEMETECKIPHDLPNFTCIEYPGKINNIDNAMETLGGHQTIQQTFTKYNEFARHNAIKSNNKNKNAPKEPYLELHLNPNGVFDHPLFGKIRSVKNCILIKKTKKIRKKKSRKRKLESTTNIEVMGRITSLVTYDELCDFQVFSELQYPKHKAMNHNNTNNSNKTIRKRNKRQRVWSLREDEVPNISKYPLVPRVFASKAMPYDGFLKESSQKTKAMKTSLERQATEIRFGREKVPSAPNKHSIWIQYMNDLKEYTSNISNRTIPNGEQSPTDSKHSFCRKIRNELVLQIKSYFEIRPIWSKAEILVQRFYIYLYHIKYFSDRMDGSEDSMSYDGDIASMIAERKQKKTFDSTKDNASKIYLNFKEKEKIISKFVGVVGYKFKNGPFRNSFIKFGFDPRDKSNKNMSRPLQIIDYRINKTNGKKLGIDTMWNITGSRVGNRGKPNTQKTDKKGMLQTMQSFLNNQQMNKETKCISKLIEEDEDNQALEQEMMERLQFKSAPDKLQMYYQLRNIDIVEVQSIINNADYNTKCARDCGWITKKDEIKIREVMNKRLKSWIQNKKKRNSDQTVASSVIMSNVLSKQTSSGSRSSSVNINENEDEKMMELDDDMTSAGHECDSMLFDISNVHEEDDDDDDDAYDDMYVQPDGDKPTPRFNGQPSYDMIHQMSFNLVTPAHSAQNTLNLNEEDLNELSQNL